MNISFNPLSSGGLASVSRGPDDSRLSPFAKLTITLRRLQQSDPIRYQQVTEQIATNLQSAAQTAESNGHPVVATHLNQLADVFTSASESGQLPNIQDLAQAVGIYHPYLLHHHRQHRLDTGSADSGATSSAGSSESSASDSSASLPDGLQPMAVILNTLSSAGITGSTS